MDFGKIFGKALRYPFRLEFYLIFFIFNLAVTIPVMFIFPYSVSADISVAQLREMLIFMIPLWLISFLVGIFLAAFFLDSANRYFPRSGYGKIKDSFNTAKKRYLPLLGTKILFFIVLGLVMIVFGGAFLLPLLCLPFHPLMLIPALILGATAVIIAAFLLFLSPVACVLDKLGPVDSLKRSFNLVRVNKINTFGFLVILLILAILISLIGSLPSIIYSLVTRNLVYGLTVENFLFTIIQLLFGSYVGMISISSQANFYQSLKKDTKGFSRAVKKRKTKKKRRKKKR
ncbi:MAG: hypothetical protein JSV92_00665 [archaeon]|nr:MAG: hypothetical protein JSV92_00665 [archaeon]